MVLKKKEEGHRNVEIQWNKIKTTILFNEISVLLYLGFLP